MANGAALIDEGLWRRDSDFRALPRMAQCTFVQILSNKDIDCAGVLTLSVEILAKACDELTVEQVWIDLKALEAARFVFVDADTDELLIRSYIKRLSARSPNMLTSALRRAKIVHSEKLRLVLANELRRLDRKDAGEVAAELDPSGTLSEPFPNPSEGVNRSETLPEPRSVVTVIGKGSSPVGGYLGENPPPKFCDQHPDGTDERCRACGARREAREAWIEQKRRSEKEHAAEQRRAEADAAAQAIAACELCDAEGYRRPELTVVCDHVDRSNTARAGLAAVRAALAKGGDPPAEPQTPPPPSDSAQKTNPGRQKAARPREHSHTPAADPTEETNHGR